MARPDFIQTDVPLGPLTALQIGGPATFFAPVSKTNDIQAALAWAQSEHQSCTCLGGGRNVLVADSGFLGLVFHPVGWHMQLDEQTIIAEAGVQLSDLLAFALNHGYGGAEWLAGIPGQLGGAIVSNAGGSHTSLSSFVVWVEAVNPDGTVQRFTPEDCAFGYRRSIFQTNGAIITSLALRLLPADRQSEQTRLAAAADRQRRLQPAGAAANMFLDPIPRRPLPTELQAQVMEEGMIAVEALIKHVDLAGHSLGGMRLDSDHPNWLVNTGDGTADQAVQLLSLVKQRVRDTLGIQLYESIRLLGF